MIDINELRKMTAENKSADKIIIEVDKVYNNILHNVVCIMKDSAKNGDYKCIFSFTEIGCNIYMTEIDKMAMRKLKNKLISEGYKISGFWGNYNYMTISWETWKE